VSDLEKPQGGAVIDGFSGLMSAIDPHDIKAGGAVEQVNITCNVVGKLRTRPGLVFADFSDGNGGTTNDVNVGVSYGSPLAKFIVYQTADGTIKAGKNPS
jgi:hypothetical protein